MADQMTPAAPPAPAAPADAKPAGPTVLCTIMDNGDGTFAIQKGAAPDAGAVPGGDQAAPQTFDGPGALLKGVLDIIREADGSADGGAQKNFSAGFEGGTNASPPKAPAEAQ